MNYTSSRNNKLSVSSAQAIVSGISSDGGLFVPESLPYFSLDKIEDMINLDYPHRSATVLSEFLPDFSFDELLSFSRSAYDSSKFPVTPAAPLVNLGNGIEVLELFHGPTCAFKDFALQMLPFFLTSALKKTGENKTAVILTATSGDTGKAALEGFADVPGVKICVFFPLGGTSTIQQLQMTTQKGGNVVSIAVRGNFDDAQSGVKRIFTDSDFACEVAEKGYFFSSANSINWGRLAPQISYYFSAYCELRKNGSIARGEEFNVTVPTGNFGDILAAYYAKICGVPIKKLICASNENNVLTDFINTGIYDRDRKFHLTTSPSMDILISSNLERLIFELSGHDSELVKGYMDSLAKTKKYEINGEIKQKISDLFAAGYADDVKTAETIGKYFKNFNYLCDPHTAVAFNVCDQYREKSSDDTVCVVVSTASPFKFAKSVLPAIGVPAPQNEFEALEKLCDISSLSIPASLAQLKSLPVRFKQDIDSADMKSAVREWLSK